MVFERIKKNFICLFVLFLIFPLSNGMNKLWHRSVLGYWLLIEISDVSFFFVCCSFFYKNGKKGKIWLNKKICCIFCVQENYFTSLAKTSIATHSFTEISGFKIPLLLRAYVTHANINLSKSNKLILFSPALSLLKRLFRINSCHILNPNNKIAITKHRYYNPTI